MARRTKEEALETRNCLINTALLLFCEKGIARTTLAEIASEAGVTRGAIYWHFANKAELFAAIWERLREPLEDLALSSERPEEPRPLEKLHRFLVAILQAVATSPAHQQVFRLLINRSGLEGDLAGIGTQLQQMHGDFCARIGRILQNAVRRGQLPKSLQVDLAAFMLHAALDGIVLNWLEGGRQRDLEAEAPRIVDALLGMLRT